MSSAKKPAARKKPVKSTSKIVIHAAPDSKEARQAAAADAAAADAAAAERANKFPASGPLAPGETFTPALGMQHYDSLNAGPIPENESSASGERKQWTQETMRDAITGYIPLGPEMWDKIPFGSHIRYLVRGTEPELERFRGGGFFRGIVTIVGESFLEISFSHNKSGGHMYRVRVSQVERIWKRLCVTSQIELIMVRQTLADLRGMIRELGERLDRLEPRGAGALVPQQRAPSPSFFGRPASPSAPRARSGSLA